MLPHSKPWSETDKFGEHCCIKFNSGVIVKTLVKPTQLFIDMQKEEKPLLSESTQPLIQAENQTIWDSIPPGEKTTPLAQLLKRIARVK